MDQAKKLGKLDSLQDNLISKDETMSKKLEQTNPIRVYAEMREKEFALVQIVD
ncbi:hypothetical protein [Chryseobacterium shandongense]|uniref:hypothetical protein n=1 Tax=Chryseobacterium shandongense TaxID=1493872 RepID=UPI0013DE7710|nr:hypothetical protein [Chryseobacterium shandongense]